MCKNTGCSSCNGNCGCSCDACCNNNCNSCCDPCAENVCGCDFEMSAGCIRIERDFECIGTHEGQTVEQAFEQINSKLCELSPGIDGVDGDSAYEIWINLGNTGTEQDFIDSLNGEDGTDGTGLDHVSFTSSTGGGAAGQPGETDTYTVWGDVGETISLGTFDVYNGADGTNGVAGQTVDHVSFTSSTGGGAAGQPGETDTYTVWGDVGETISLGTFVVYNGADGVDGVTPPPKINFYESYIADLQVADSLPDPSIYHFPPGYEILTYTNTTGVTKDFIVEVSYETLMQGGNVVDISNWVDGAIVKTVASVDSVVWENLTQWDFRISLYDGPTPSDTVNTASAEKVLTDPSGNAVESRIGAINLNKNNSFFAKVTLNDNETASLKFKTKDASAASRLIKAQFFIQELD